MRAGKRARTYLPAIAVLERADESIGPLDVEGLADCRPARSTRPSPTPSMHSSDGVTRSPLYVRRGILVGGPVSYAHHAHPHHPDRAGIRVGEETVPADADQRDIELICARPATKPRRPVEPPRRSHPIAAFRPRRNRIVEVQGRWPPPGGGYLRRWRRRLW